MSPGFPKGPVHPKLRGSWGAPFCHPPPPPRGEDGGGLPLAWRGETEGGGGALLCTWAEGCAASPLWVWEARTAPPPGDPRDGSPGRLGEVRGAGGQRPDHGRREGAELGRLTPWRRWRRRRDPRGPRRAPRPSGSCSGAARS